MQRLCQFMSFRQYPAKMLKSHGCLDDLALGVVQVAAPTLGPAYTYAVSPRFELDASVRATALAFIGGRADIGAQDNVIETPAHLGAVGRAGAIFRPRPSGTFALTSAFSAGPQYSGFQRTFLVSWMLGVQWN